MKSGTRNKNEWILKRNVEIGRIEKIVLINRQSHLLEINLPGTRRASSFYKILKKILRNSRA